MECCRVSRRQVFESVESNDETTYVLRITRRQGNSSSFRRRIAAIDPGAAIKVDAVLESQRKRLASIPIRNAAKIGAPANK